MIFASKNAFNLFTQSRRDDLISLCYLLVYIVDGDLAFLSKDSDADNEALMESQPPAADNSASGSSRSRGEVKFKEDEFCRLRRAKNSLKPE